MSSSPSQACFVTKIDLSMREKMERDLPAKGFTLHSLAHGFFSARKPGICCNLYHSGKLTVQGKEKDSFIEFYLEPEILKSVEYTHREAFLDVSPRIGLDEAGKGDFFGPLCLAGIFIPEGDAKRLDRLGVKDSKKMQDSTLVNIARDLKRSYPHKVLALFPETYNRLYGKFRNLNQLLGWGHATVLEELSKSTGCKNIILDQFAAPELMNSILQKRGVEVDLTQRVRAEEDPVVAAASILARAAFVEGIASLETSLGLRLPKGASSAVITAGQEAVRVKGVEILPKISKTHFKTTQAVLC